MTEPVTPKICEIGHNKFYPIKLINISYLYYRVCKTEVDDIFQFTWFILFLEYIS